MATLRPFSSRFIVEDVKNIGPNYDPTLLAWEENFRRAWPRFADRYGTFPADVAILSARLRRRISGA
jgi:cyclopropane fatty-acyl-phospholipid synthase-like methyltransferase